MGELWENVWKKKRLINEWGKENYFFVKGINQGKFAKVPVNPSPMYFKEILMPQG